MKSFLPVVLVLAAITLIASCYAAMVVSNYRECRRHGFSAAYCLVGR